MDKQLFEERIQFFVKQRQRQEGTINAMMNMELVSFDFDKKEVVLAFPVEQWQLNPAGNMHGGMIATALDIAMGCVAYCSKEVSFTPTIQMAVNFVGSIPYGEVLIVKAIGDHMGSRLSQLRAIATLQSNQKVVATANGSYVMNTKKG